MKVIYSYEEVKVSKNLSGTFEEKIADRITIAANVAQDLSDFRQETKAMIAEAVEAKRLNVSRLEKIMQAAGWSKQAISAELRSYGINRRASSKAKAAESAKVQAKAQAEFVTLAKRYSDKKELAAIASRIYKLAREAANK
jgi:hypothetical protein